MLYFSLVLISLSILITGTQGQTPASAEDYSQRGIARFEKNELNAAIADFTKAIELKGPNQEFCFYFRGMAHYRQTDLDLALADISRAITLKQHPRFYDDRGSILIKKGDLDGAIADLSKAIELAPQFAKAYGDRGIARLMRGENAQAELDFKKCFELDNTLQAQFTTAANQLKQSAVPRDGFQQPSDVKVIKFSWSESPVRELNPTFPITPVTSSAVSQTGTRVLADPSAKGGPPDVGWDPDMNSSAPRRSNAGAKIIQENFNVVIQNIGTKTIVGIRWAYFFYPKDKTRDPTSFIFDAKTNIAPGKGKTLSAEGFAPSFPDNRIQVPTQKTRTLFDEQVVALHVDYADGSMWPTPRP